MRERTMHYTDNTACSIGRWSGCPLGVVRRWSWIAIATTALVFLVGCGPEDRRAVGGGLGADLGNHSEDVPRSKLFVPGSQGAEDAQP